MKTRVRVEVWNGDRSRFIGRGWHVGNEMVYVIEDRRGDGLCLRSEADPTLPPDISDLPEGCTVKPLGQNPRIDLDNGKTVYGCQVWWREVRSADCNG